MSKAKWLGVILFGVLTGGVGFVIYFAWRYIKLCIKLDIFIAYLIVRIPILLVQLVLYYGLKVPGHKVSHVLHAGYTETVQAKRSTMLIGAVSFLFFFFIVGFPAELSLGSFMSGVVRLGLILVPTALITLAINILRYHMSDVQMARSDLEGTALAGAGAAAAGTAAGAAETAGQAKGVYDDIQQAASGEEGIAVGDLESVTGGILDEVGLGGIIGGGAEAEAAGASVAEGSAAAAGSAALGPLVIGIIIVFVLALFGIVFQAILFTWFFLGFIQGILGAVASPIMSAIGLGGSYADLFGQQAANRVLPGIGQIGAVEQTSTMFSSTAAKLGCMLQGPACYRQWQLNQTQRPGSEDVGEQYGLKIDTFRVGQGSNLDVAYKDTNYAIPVSFTLSNPRHGLKGINAKDVKYRLRVVDASETYCDTGWIDVDAYDVPDDGDQNPNDIYPGTSASTGFLTLEDEDTPGDALTLKSCGFLQPALGSFKTVMLHVKYDYFSQSTLYFQAMSLQTLQSNPDIQKSMKDSVTADTPVKAAISVNEPVIFNQDTMEPQPFAVRSTLETEEFDLRYKVQSFEVQKSQRTEIADAGSCRFEETEDPDDEQKLELTSEAKTSILAGEVPEERWFTQDQKPPIFGCVMQLSNPDKISPSGETLTMGVEADYTVNLEQRIDGFEVYNSRCGPRLNCPLLVTEYYNHTAKPSSSKYYGDYNWMTRCTGIDAGNGCTVVRGPDAYNWNRGEALLTGSGPGKLDKQLEDGEFAFDPAALVERFGEMDNFTVGPLFKDLKGAKPGTGMSGEGNLEKRTVAIGLSREDYRILKPSRYGASEDDIEYVEVAEDREDGGFILYLDRWGEKEPVVEEVNRECSDDSGNKEEFVREWIDSHVGDKEDLFQEVIMAYHVKSCSG